MYICISKGACNEFEISKFAWYFDKAKFESLKLYSSMSILQIVKIDLNYLQSLLLLCNFHWILPEAERGL